jgi:hypothetical protein
MPRPLEALHRDMFGVSVGEGLSVVLIPWVAEAPESWEALLPDDVDAITSETEARISAAMMCDVAVMGTRSEASSTHVRLVGGPRVFTVAHSQFEHFLRDADRAADRCMSVHQFIRLDTCGEFGTFLSALQPVELAAAEPAAAELAAADLLGHLPMQQARTSRRNDVFGWLTIAAVLACFFGVPGWVTFDAVREWRRHALLQSKATPVVSGTLMELRSSSSLKTPTTQSATFTYRVGAVNYTAHRQVDSAVAAALVEGNSVDIRHSATNPQVSDIQGNDIRQERTAFAALLDTAVIGFGLTMVRVSKRT